MIEKILFVEDDKFIASQVKEALEQSLNYPILWAQNYGLAKHILEQKKNIIAAILDYNLPDAPNGEVIDLVLKENIPSVVFTGRLDNDIRNKFWKSHIADYILKDEPSALEYLSKTVKTICHNHQYKVLVVDDSALFRNTIVKLLKIHRYTVLSAETAKEGLDLIQQHTDLKLVISDYEMPKMNGLEFVREIRKNYSKDKLAIIGISAAGNPLLSAKFIKNGANDFLIKQSFLPEEFYIRVNQCIENLELISKIKEISIRDPLTGLYNRRYLFEEGSIFLSNPKNVSCAMVDIDFFKKINDNYGHDVGDIALKHIADLMKTTFSNNAIVARFGGEEFCILTENDGGKSVGLAFDSLRDKIEKTPVSLSETETISLTISIGVCISKKESLENMIKEADKNLYRAKRSGRNQVII